MLICPAFFIWIAFSSNCNIICLRYIYNLWFILRHIKFFKFFLKIKSHNNLH